MNDLRSRVGYLHLLNKGHFINVFVCLFHMKKKQVVLSKFVRLLTGLTQWTRNLKVLQQCRIKHAVILG